MVAAMPAAPDVCAVVVTHNRRALLEQCLAALEAQTRGPGRVLVVDNASTDGTPELLRERFPAADVLRLPDNRGGAGGFHAGLGAAVAGGTAWAWIMDDDTIPAPDALEALLAASPPPDLPAPLLLAPQVRWVDGSLHPMNDPVFKRDPALFAAGVERRLLPLRTVTFPGLLVHREAVERFGLPLAEFFIWSDDLEYTGRVLRDAPTGWLVPDAVVEHRTKAAHTAITHSGERYYFHVRNTLHMVRGRSFRAGERLSLAFWLARSLGDYLRVNRCSALSLRTVARGLRDGLRPLRSA
jgi:GT2 family glycosyltransferase